MNTIELRVLLTPSCCGGYYAQVLERDIAAHGKDIDSALADLSRVLNVHIAASHDLGREPFVGLDPAPEEYLSLWDKARSIKAELPNLCPTVVERPQIASQFAVV